GARYPGLIDQSINPSEVDQRGYCCRGKDNRRDEDSAMFSNVSQRYNELSQNRHESDSNPLSCCALSSRQIETLRSQLTEFISFRNNKLLHRIRYITLHHELCCILHYSIGQYLAWRVRFFDGFQPANIDRRR